MPKPGQESVWDYPRPPRIERLDARVRVELGGIALAETTHALRVCETASPPTVYLPLRSVRTDLLERAPGSTLCEWKGHAQYLDAQVGGLRAKRAAWTYPEPFESYETLRDYIAFFPGRVEACLIDDERVRPQPGDYYGGWITRDLTGPFKGEPGSEGW
jgi:uncharacterized protein (DUF427 family)